MGLNIGVVVGDDHVRDPPTCVIILILDRMRKDPIDNDEIQRKKVGFERHESVEEALDVGFQRLEGGEGHGSFSPTCFSIGDSVVYRCPLPETYDSIILLRKRILMSTVIYGFIIVGRT